MRYSIPKVICWKSFVLWILSPLIDCINLLVFMKREGLQECISRHVNLKLPLTLLKLNIKNETPKAPGVLPRLAYVTTHEHMRILRHFSTTAEI